MSNSPIDENDQAFWVAKCRQQLWRNGFRPVPILNPEALKGAGKRPAGSGQHWSRWEQDARQDPPYAVTTRPIDCAHNTGILADDLQPFDNDIDDPELAKAVDRLCVEMLGDAPMRYREDSPRTLRLYRAAEGEPRHAEVRESEATAKAAGRRPWGVEMLGKDNQFLAFGYHPDGAFLDWQDGRSPLTVPRDQLPAVTEAQVEEFLALAGELIGAEPSCQNRQNRQNPPTVEQGGPTGEAFGGFNGFVMPDGDTALGDVLAALSVVQGDGGSYALWVRVGMAIHAATGGSPAGVTAYDEWSQKSPKYDPAAVRKMWRTFRPRSIGFGTLVHLARQADPTWRAPSWSSGADIGNQNDAPPARIAVDILNRNVAPPPIMPLAVFGTGWGEWLQQAAVAANAPVDYVTTSLLAAAGSLIGNACWGQAWPGWAEPPVLWCALVGEPSASKTPAANAVLKLLRHVETDLGEGFAETSAAWEEIVARAKSDRKQWEAALEDGNDAPTPRSTIPPEPMRPVASTSSVTVKKVATMLQSQPKAFLVSNDELAAWLGNMQRYSSGTDRPFWPTAWTGSPYRVDRQSRPTTIIPYLSLGVFGTIQPDRLAATLSGTDDGLPARLLFCWPDARPFARPRGTVNVSRAIAALCKLARLKMQEAEDGSPVPVFITATEEAAAVLTCFAIEMQVRELHVGGVMKGVLGKARGYALRLGLVFEFLSWSWSDNAVPTSISARAMRAGVEMMRTYFLPMATRTLGDATISQQERNARNLANWIAVERPDRINLRELSRGRTGGTMLHGLRQPAELQAAVAYLRDCGWFQHDTLAKTGGRPRSEYLIAPAFGRPSMNMSAKTAKTAKSWWQVKRTGVLTLLTVLSERLRRPMNRRCLPTRPTI
jgi:hypothetical protein